MNDILLEHTTAGEPGIFQQFTGNSFAPKTIFINGVERQQ